MKFKCEIQLNNSKSTVVKTYIAKTLTELYDKIYEEFPGSKPISIVGGSEDGQ